MWLDELTLLALTVWYFCYYVLSLCEACFLLSVTLEFVSSLVCTSLVISHVVKGTYTFKNTVTKATFEYVTCGVISHFV